MSNAKSSWSKWSPVSVAFLALAAFAIPALGQEADKTSAPAGSYVDDWSAHHVRFSNPGTREDAVNNGTLDKWLKITNDPRYQMQITKRSMGTLPAAADPNLTTADTNLATETVDAVGNLAKRPGFPLRPLPFLGNGIKKDWSMNDGVPGNPSLTITVNAPGSGNVTGGTSTIMVDGQSFTASAPAAASQTGTFSSAPTSTSNAISVKVGSNTLNLSTNATAASATANVSAIPASASTTALSIVNNDGTVNMAPTGASALTGTVTFSAVPTSASTNALSIVNSDGTVNMTPSGATAASAGTVTVSAVPTSASSNVLTIANGDGTVNMAPTGASALTGTVTFSAMPTSASTNALSIVNSDGTVNMTPSGATAASAGTVTVSAVPTSAGSNVLTIANGDGTVNMAPTGASALTGTVTVSAVPTSASSNVLTIVNSDGTVNMTPGGASAATTTATFSTTGTTSTTAKIVNSATGATGVTLTAGAAGVIQVDVAGATIRTLTVSNYTYSFSTACSNQVAGNCIYAPTTGSTTTIAENIEAAINDNSGQCGVTNSSNGCFGTGITSQATGVTAEIATAGYVYLTVTSGTPNFYLSSTTTYLTLTPANSGGGTISAVPNACGSATAGTFAIASTTALTASNLYTALISASCQTTYPIGVSAANPSGASSFLITDSVLGYATFTAGGTGLTLSPGTGGSNGTGNSCSTPGSGTFLLAGASIVPTTSTVATQLQAALGMCSSSGFTAGTVTANAFPLTDSVLGYATFTPLSGITTVTGASGGSNGTANSCTTPGSGTFLLAGASIVPTTSTAATQLQAALAACSASGISVGTVTTNHFTLADTALGYATFTPLTGITTVSSASGGTNGTANACGTPTAGTFILNTAGNVPTTSTAASELKAALGMCSSSGFTAGTVTANTFPLTDTVLGYATFTPLTNVTTVTGTSGGSNGTANACSTPGSGTFLLAGTSIVPTTSTAATQLQAALTACSASGISLGTPSANTFTLTDSVLGYATFTALSGITTVSSASGGTNGTANACGTPTAGTFILNTAGNVPTTSTAASELKAALGMCSSSGFTAGTVTANAFPLTDSVLGYATFTPLTNVTTVTGASGGSNGTANACSGASPVSGTFLLAGASIVPTTSTVTTQLQAALAACPATAGFGAGTVSSNTFPVTDTVLGSATFTGSSGLSWTGVNNGGNGAYSCSGPAPTFTATYASGPTATLASNLSTAIASCNAPTMGITSTYTSGSSFTVADATAGTGGNTGTALTPTGAGYFAWSSGSLTGGSNGGGDTASLFNYWTGSTYESADQLASDLYSAFNANGTLTGAFTITNPSGTSNTITLTAKASGSYTASANGNPGTLVTFLNGGFIDGTGGVNANTFPAKYGFDTGNTATCADYVVYPTGGTGATLIAYNNIYSGTCTTGNVPNVAWAYNTGNGTAVTSVLSPTLSIDGTQVAYIQSTSSNVAELVILKPLAGTNNGTVSSPAAATYVSNASYRACGAPCYTTIALDNSPNDTNSSPYYIYSTGSSIGFNDIIFVGDNSGQLHEFAGVFLGTPAEVTTSGWPVTVGASADVLTSPIYDNASGKIFVADSGGYLYSYNASTALQVMKSSKLTYAGGTTGIVDGPLIDSSTEEVYVFVGDDSNTATGGNYTCANATGCSGVFQFAAGNTTIGTGACVAGSNTTWSSGTNCGEEAVFGAGTTATPTIYAGDFDHIYQVGAGTTGNLWACSANASSEPRLSAVTIQSNGGIVPSGDVTSANQIGTSVITAIAALTSAAASCSPVTEFWGSDGTTTDYIYASVTASGNRTGCTGACLYNFVVANGGTATTAGALAVPLNATAGIASAGGSSGIVVDNLSTTTGESQIYYSNLSTQSCTGTTATGSGTGSCAVQTSQTAP